MDLEPIAVLLQFGFLAILYLTLILIARSALKDLRRSSAPPETGIHQLADPSHHSPTSVAWLEVASGAGLEPGRRYELVGDVVIGRGGGCDLVLQDDFASQMHARVSEQAGRHVAEDLGSTNGTYLNGSRLEGVATLSAGDRLRIGDTELVFVEA